MTITLEAIKAEHSKIGEMIAAFERKASVKEYQIAATTIRLALGERYAGLVLGESGEADYHLILIPGDAKEVSWAEARSWAADQGGSLPTRREQSLLFANLKGEFKSEWYWSDEQHESNSGWAWYQSFGYGSQGYDGTDFRLRARAVRRLILQ